MCLSRSALTHFARTLLLVPAIAVMLTVSALHAQVAGTGTIQGNVTDATGAFIPNATVTLVEASTQVKRVAQSDSSGAYNFPNIEIGTYSLTVSVPGI